MSGRIAVVKISSQFYFITPFVFHLELSCFIVFLCLICVVLQILFYLNLSFYILVSSCWLSSTNNLIWIFITFVAFIEVVSLINWDLINIFIIVIIIIVGNIIVISYLHQDCLLLEIFITKYLPSFKRMPTPISIHRLISVMSVVCGQLNSRLKIT